jgi:hypothetical protein
VHLQKDIAQCALVIAVENSATSVRPVPSFYLVRACTTYIPTKTKSNSLRAKSGSWSLQQLPARHGMERRAGNVEVVPPHPATNLTSENVSRRVAVEGIEPH